MCSTSEINAHFSRYFKNIHRKQKITGFTIYETELDVIGIENIK